MIVVGKFDNIKKARRIQKQHLLWWWGEGEGGNVFKERVKS